MYRKPLMWFIRSYENIFSFYFDSFVSNHSLLKLRLTGRYLPTMMTISSLCNVLPEILSKNIRAPSKRTRYISVKMAQGLKQMEVKYHYPQPLFIFAGEVNTNCLIV